MPYSVVGNCPACGSPVYGQADGDAGIVYLTKRTCACRHTADNHTSCWTAFLAGVVLTLGVVATNGFVLWYLHAHGK